MEAKSASRVVPEPFGAELILAVCVCRPVGYSPFLFICGALLNNVPTLNTSQTLVLAAVECLHVLYIHTWSRGYLLQL